MAEALIYAEGDGQRPAELQIADAIKRFGVKAVTGKDVIRPGLIRRIDMAETIVMAYRSRGAAESWAGWCNENPELAELLARAQQVKHGK